MDHATVRRVPDRARYDRTTVHAVLDAGALCHVGFVQDDRPFVIPMAYARDGDALLLHGSAASRLQRHVAGGVPACVTVTHLDGVVLARSVFHHSMNYRSVVCFGTARPVEGDDKRQALRVLTDHLAPGRWGAAREPSGRELQATSVLRFRIEEASAKERSGPPVDDEADLGRAVWAGVVPAALVAGTPDGQGGAPPDVPVWLAHVGPDEHDGSSRPPQA